MVGFWLAPRWVFKSVASGLGRLRMRFLSRKFQRGFRSDFAILNRYGDFLAELPVIPVRVYDRASLPLPKERVRTALLRHLLVESNPEWRRLLIYGLTCLSRFQPGVGPIPLDPYGTRHLHTPNVREAAEAIARMPPPTAWEQSLIDRADAEMARMAELVAGGPREIALYVNRRRMGMES